MKAIAIAVLAVVLLVVATVTVEAASGNEACATKVVRGPRGFRGEPGQQGPSGEIPWPGILLVALTGGLVGAGLGIALGCRHHNPVVWRQGQPPVNITNNVYGDRRPDQRPGA